MRTDLAQKERKGERERERKKEGGTLIGRIRRQGRESNPLTFHRTGNPRLCTWRGTSSSAQDDERENGVSSRASVRLPIPDERISLKADLHFSQALYDDCPTLVRSIHLPRYLRKFAFLTAFFSYGILMMGSRLICCRWRRPRSSSERKTRTGRNGARSVSSFSHSITRTAS